MSKVFKIRSKKTGLFSLGTMRPKWSKHGKVWTSMSAINKHLNIYNTGGGGYLSGNKLSTEYADNEAEIVGFELIETIAVPIHFICEENK